MLVEDYVRNAVLVKVIDGDTVELNIDLGFRIWYRTRVRLLGVDCPERKGPTREAGDRARLYVVGWFAEEPAVQVRTHRDKSDSFGRLLAEVRRGDKDLAADLVASGNAVLAPR